MMAINYWVVDTETSVNGPADFPAWPFADENRIVMGCIKSSPPFTGEDPTLSIGSGISWDRRVRVNAKGGIEGTLFIVGHNVKFDFHYIRKNKSTNWQEFWTENTYLWDTQIVEYILSGQTARFASLNDLATKYGIPTKIVGVKELWERGVKTEDIDKDLLEKYVRHDVEITEQVFLKQLAIVQDRNLLPLVISIMDATLGVAEAEYNGLCVDKTKLDEFGKECLSDMIMYEASFKEMLYGRLPKDAQDKLCKDKTHSLRFSITSNKDIGKLFYDSTVTLTKEELVKLKNGKERVKTTNETVTLAIPFELGSKSVDDSVSESKLLELEAYDATAAPFVSALLSYRGARKAHGTYYEGIKELVDSTSRLHPQLHQTSTTTGRLSSARPNVQNFPRATGSEFKECIIPYYPDGSFVEFDYKQIEIVACAYLSEDPQLIKDLKDGVDIHDATARLVYGRKPTEEERVACKIINFGGGIYRGSAKTIAKQAGVDVKLAKMCIEAFFMRYPKVKVWQAKVAANLKLSAVHTGHKTTKGVPAKTGIIPSFTGRHYVLNEYDAPDWAFSTRGSITSFSPNEMANYPVQGLATGDIVPLMLGKLTRYLLEKKERYDRIKIVNTVHDSILISCAPTVSMHEVKEIQKLLETAPQVISETFGVHFDLPLKVDVKTGLTWGALRKLK